MTKTNNNNNNKQNKIKEIDIKIPKKVEKELARINTKPARGSSVGVARRTNISGVETLHSTSFDPTQNKMKISGTCLLCYLDPKATTLLTKSVFLYRRMFLHPALLYSRKLAYMAKMFSKYKFTNLRLEFQSQQPSTATGTIHFAYSKNYGCGQPYPGTSLLAWMSEMDGYTQTKIWEDCHIPRASTEGDLPSYYLDRTQTDIDTVYQNSLLIAISKDVNDKLAGELYMHFDVEFETMNAPPANFTDESSFMAKASVNNLENVLKWRTADSDAIKFWGPRAGVYYCTLAGAWSGFTLSEFASNNDMGMPFILSAQGVSESGWTGQYTAIEFEIYDSMSSLLDNNSVEKSTGLLPDLYFNGVCLLATSVPVIENVVPLQAKEPGLCGISVGPGVLAGDPDVLPSLDFQHGRIHLGVHGPTRYR